MVGNNTIIYVPSKTLIDLQNPHMIQIGENVKITEGVKILTHDFTWCVTSQIDGTITGNVGSVEIGNNVFIGMNSIITKDVKIGNNVIIGAGSIVTKDCDDNSVYAGVPAKKIMSIKEYYFKRKERQIEEAKNIAIKYYQNTGRLPDLKVLREYSFLFGNKLNSTVEQVLRDSGHFEKCLKTFKEHKPEFDSVDNFLEYCEIKKRKDL